jgi:hypothetical protein
MTIRPLRVCIYGGTDLQGVPVELGSELAYELLRSSPSVIVTGGFRYSNEKPGAVSTDVAALRGAQRYAEETGTDLKRCYEAWIPDPALDDRPELEGVVRLSAADGISVRVMAGRTPLGRRLAMVAGVDLVVTIAGRRHTEVVVEQALERGIPVLPIPNAGGDSERLLEKYRARIAAAFEPGAMDGCLQQVSQKIARDPASAARAIVDLVRTAKVGRCLVLLPYDDEHNELYGSRIEPAVANWMVPTRLDRFPKSEEIQIAFAEAVRTSAAVIADITDLNENVMYEIGYARASGVTPLIYTRKADRLENLPVYFRTMNVRLASPQTPVEALIDGYLRSVKATPIVPPIHAGAL